MFEINCPSCGSPVKFRMESSVYSICDSCRSVLVRNDVNVELIGKASDLHPDCTPLQIGTSGQYEGKGFEIIGRLQIKHSEGYWNEWYLIFGNGDTGWLSESLGEYFISTLVDTKELKVPPASSLRKDSIVELGKRRFIVSNRGASMVHSYEGELPFIMGAAYELPYADLRSTSEMAGTIDYSENPPLLFLGYYKEFKSFKFQGLRDLDDEAQKRSAKTISSLKCPTCGAPHELAAGPRTQTLVCEYCDSCIDTTTPALNVIWKASQKLNKLKPVIPIGTKGKIEDVEWECLGYMRKYSTYMRTKYYWCEYLFYNRENGYRYLVESEGHWSWVNTIHSVPAIGSQIASSNTSENVTAEGREYKHFSSYFGFIDYVVGEFPFRITLDSKTAHSDFICPPYGLSCESDKEGTYWSVAEHLEAEQVRQIFKIESPLPNSSGIGPFQPSAYKGIFNSTIIWSLLFALIGFILMAITSIRSENVFSQQYELRTDTEACVVSDDFVLPSSTRSVEVEFSTNLDNRWCYFDVALINKDTNEATCFGKTASFYSGYDWSEGSRKCSIIVPKIKGGNYYLRIDPQSGKNNDPDRIDPSAPKGSGKSLVIYTVDVSTNPAMWVIYLVLLGILIVPPIIFGLLYSSEETSRWADSDHPLVDDDDDDD